MMAQRCVKEGCRLTAVDQPSIASADELFNLDPGSFTVVPNGVAGTQSFRSPAEHEKSPLRVGFVGLVQEGKGWHIAAEAVERVRQGGAKVSFVIAGSGPEADLARKWCEHRSDYAKYLGHVSAPDRTLMPRLDVLCLLSHVEGLPMVILEAMATGAVVISTPVGGVPAVIDHGRNGYLVDRTSDSVSACLSRLAKDRQCLADLSRNAILKIQSFYTLESISEQYDRVYFSRKPSRPAPSR
jgi:glycosyltransferase involved in cell wall biosynthesis